MTPTKPRECAECGTESMLIREDDEWICVTCSVENDPEEPHVPD